MIKDIKSRGGIKGNKDTKRQAGNGWVNRYKKLIKGVNSFNKYILEKRDNSSFHLREAEKLDVLVILLDLIFWIPLISCLTRYPGYS